MTTKLDIFNQALLHLRESALSSLSENREARRVLDTFYADVLSFCLEAGFWKFAIRTIKIDADAAITPEFGPQYAFNKPTDWVKTYAVSASETLVPPLDDWLEESNLFFSNVTPIYLRYVSNADPGYGFDLTRWTSKFTKAVVMELAWRICPKVTGSSDAKKDDIEKDKVKAMAEAKAFEALREPSRHPPQGRWNSSRFARRNGGDWTGGYRIG